MLTPEETVVKVVKGNPLLTFSGLFPLPVGTRIELNNVAGEKVPLDSEKFSEGRVDAVVVRVRVAHTLTPNRCLVLEVELRQPGEEL